MHTAPTRSRVAPEGTQPAPFAARVARACGVLLVGSSLACGGSQPAASAQETTPEPAVEPAPAPQPRGTATALAPSGADRTLPSSGRTPPPSSGTDPAPFVEPPRTGRVHPGLATEEPEPYFDAEIVSTRLRAVGSEISACYERELARDPSLHGTLNVEFRLLPSGDVVDAVAIENSVSPSVATCVTGVIGALHFSPGPVGGSILYRYPFVFERNGH